MVILSILLVVYFGIVSTEHVNDAYLRAFGAGTMALGQNPIKSSQVLALRTGVAYGRPLARKAKPQSWAELGSCSRSLIGR